MNLTIDIWKNIQDFLQVVGFLVLLLITIFALVIFIAKLFTKPRLAEKMTITDRVRLSGDLGFVTLLATTHNRFNGKSTRDAMERAVLVHQFIQECGYELATLDVLEEALKFSGKSETRGYVYLGNDEGPEFLYNQADEVLGSQEITEFLYAVHTQQGARATSKILAPA